MKHLFRLALKYVTRQKLRTALMFLSVMLAVLVLNTFLIYTASGIRTLRNQFIYEDGEWEANMSGVLDACEAGESATVNSRYEAAKIISDHVAVDKYHIYLNEQYYFTSEQGLDSQFGFFDVELDRGGKKRMTSVGSTSAEGALELGRYASFGISSDELAPDEVRVPQWFEDEGYKEGDTFSVTITPSSGMIKEDSDTMKAVRKGIAEANEKSENSYYIIEGEEPDNDARNGRRIVRRPIRYYIQEYSDMNDIVLSDSETGTSVTVTGRIAGFTPSGDQGTFLTFYIPANSAVDLSPLKESPVGYMYDNGSSCFVKTNPNTSFEYNMKLLLKDLGFDEEDAYEDFKYAMHGYKLDLNTSYMIVSFRSVEGMGAVVPFIAVYLILLLIVWLFSRFIIDNAFEISVQERSRQFAALRIMGASKGQLSTLVFIEGLFYSLTAVPLGIVASTFACKHVFESLNSVGLDVFEFYASPLTMLICVALCLVGIFISTYTSAMWAARKLSPVEALKFGQPKTKKASKRAAKKQRKSKLNLSSKRFMIRYTMKNILRTKSRFIISSVAMGLGVLLFTICLQLGISLYSEVREEMGLDEPRFDFYIYLNELDAGDIQEQLMDSGNFSYSRRSGNFSDSFEMNELQKLGDEKKALERKFIDLDSFVIGMETMDKETFEFPIGLTDMDTSDGENNKMSYAEFLGMSYEEFESGKPILILPQMDYDFQATSYGYGYNELSSPVSLNGESGFSYELRGIAHAGYSSVILLPESVGDELVKKGVYMDENLFLTVADPEHYPAAKELIKSVLKPTDEFYDEYLTGTGMMTFIKSIVEIALIFMLSIWLCGIVSMMNTINSSALNRSGELMMMRAVGMTHRQLTGTVLLESLLFSAVSAIGGTLVSIAGYQLIMRLIFERSEVQSSVAALIASAALNVAIAFAASIPAIRTLNRSVTK